MEPLEYIKMFKMNQPNYEFNREDFLKKLNEEFQAQVNNPNPSMGGVDPKTKKLTYPKFKEIVKNFEVKFKAIQELKEGNQLTINLWKAFFAIYVVPVRKNLFPEEHTRICNNKAKGVPGYRALKTRVHKTK